VGSMYCLGQLWQTSCHKFEFLTMRITTIFWKMTLCNLAEVSDVFQWHTVSILRVYEWVNQTNNQNQMKKCRFWLGVGAQLVLCGLFCPSQCLHFLGTWLGLLNDILPYSLAMKKDTVCLSGTLVNFYHTTWHHIAGDRIFNVSCAYHGFGRYVSGGKLF
jgi:hypothetical protein